MSVTIHKQYNIPREVVLRLGRSWKHFSNTLDLLFPTSAIPDYNGALGPQRSLKSDQFQKKRTIAYALLASLFIQPAGWLTLGLYGSNFMSLFFIAWGSLGMFLLFLMHKNEIDQLKKENNEQNEKISSLNEVVNELRVEMDTIKKRLAMN